ncbi:MAG: 50S ribosomal protein L4 [Candidatus Dormibacteria bacterium]
MTAAAIVDAKGASKGSVDLPESLFGGPVNRAVMHQALVRQLANARQGTSDTRVRSEVRGGGRKPHRQKGTGRARQGSIRSPHYAGGGVVFGPHPRSFRLDMPRKQRRLALRSALAAKAADSAISVLDGFTAEAPSTRAVADLLTAIGAGARALVILGSHNDVLEKSARNLPGVTVILAGNLSVRDLMVADTILITPDGLDHIASTFGAAA